MFVYMIINDATGKFYVGKTVHPSLAKYFRDQVACALAGYTDKPYLYNAIRKHGADKFRIHVLMGTLKTNEELCRWEKFLIGLFKAQDRSIGYNIEGGGQGRTSENVSGEKNPFFGKTHTPEVRERLRRAHLGKRNPHAGDVGSEEKRQKCREAALNQWASGKGWKYKKADQCASTQN